MFITMVLAFFISRLILENLGATDYGIYGVVGSVVTLLSFFNMAMITAGQRCLSYDLGGQVSSFNKTFGSIFIISLAIGIVIFIILQFSGTYLIEEYLNIPSDRVPAAITVFHASCFTFLIQTIQVPFVASLISQERLAIYAYLGILDTVLRFIICLMLSYTIFDKLIFYAISIAVSTLFIFILYFRFSTRKFKLSFNVSKGNLLLVFKFFGWNLFGGLSSVSLYQGIQIVLNLFFGPVVNAAQTLTLQVKSAIESFASNIRVASNPQIVKKCAEGKLEEASDLLRLSIKLSTVIILLISIPIYLEAEFILTLWLDKVPDHTSVFLKFYIVNAIIDVVSSPIVTVIQAIGNIRNYQLLTSGVLLTVLPVTYLLFVKGYPPYIFGFVLISATMILLFIRLIFLFKILPCSKRLFVIIPGLVFCVSTLFTSQVQPNLLNLIVLVIISSLSVLSFSWMLLLNKEDKSQVSQFLKDKINR
jgi:O-antigen/teichoic acid export membrane protein